MREARGVLAVLGGLACAVVLPACKSNQACRPGTVFLRASVDSAISTADTIKVTVKRDGKPDVQLGPFQRVTGVRQESIEIDFASYPAHSTVTFDLELTANGQLVATGEKQLTLDSGCTAADVPLSAMMVVQDLAGVDFTGVDFSPVPHDLAGADLTEPPPPDLAGADFSNADLSVLADLAVNGDAPGAPTSVTATANIGGKVALSWLAPSSVGSSPITGYSIESVPAGLTTTVATLNYTTPALTLGTSYTFNVKAFNSFGTGPAGASNSVVAGDVPAAVTGLSATAPSGRAVASWTAADPHGYAISSYLVVANPGGKSVSVAGNQTTGTITGLSNGTQYTLTVTATNSWGSGPGATSNTITFNCSPFTYPNIVATDSASVEYGSLVQNIPEASMYAYRGDNSDLRGWAKFPLTSVVSYAQITGINLFMKVQSTAGSPSPVLEAWYSATDTWFRNMNGGTGPQPADVPPGVAVSSTFSPAAANTFQQVGLSVAAHNWTSDIVDGTLTLGVKNTVTPPVGGSSYVQYFSSDTVGNKPYIVITACQ